MDSVFDIPDSTDWLNTPLTAFSTLENALHCQICKEFYDTPMITSCAHTFCSKCIRTSLSTDGRCPACRTTDQASKLRNNWALQEVVTNFLAARPAALEVARREVEVQANEKKHGKRKRIVLDSDGVVGNEEMDGRTTRSKTRRITASQSSQQEAIEIIDSEVESDSQPEAPPDDGLVECPLGCGKRMKIEAVDPHLDRCEEEQAQASRAKSRTPINGTLTSRPNSATPKPQDRMSELNYSLLTEPKLRKKLEELGLPGWGAKSLLVKRHTAWVNLWNANCDSSRPRGKRELLQDLDTWERTQGGKAPNATGLASTVMRKDFDGAGWANRNKDDFSRLIAEAKRKKGNPALEEAKGKDVDLENEPEPATIGVGRLNPMSLDGSPDQTPEETDTRHSGSSINEQNPATTDAIDFRPATANGDVPNTPPAAAMSESIRDEHLDPGPSGSPCALPAHLASGAVKKVPMFAVPQAAVTDVDGPGESR